jgi:NDP-sugar pyrophosphorylase family protein
LKNHSAINVNSGISILPPYVTKKRFSELSGLEEEVIRGMIDKGHLPTVKIGRYRLINLTLITKEALEQEKH